MIQTVIVMLPLTLEDVYVCVFVCACVSGRFVYLNGAIISFNRVLDSRMCLSMPMQSSTLIE